MSFNPNIIYHTKYITTDNLVPGDFVVAYNYNAGEIRVKKAVVNPYLLVVGFVRTAYSAGMEIYLYRLEFINDKLSGLVVGDDYYAHPTIPGAVTNVVPTGVFVAQKLGKAISTTKLDTRYNELVYIGAGGSPGGPAGGDLTGTYPNPGVNWANGLPVYDLQYYPLVANPAGYIDATALTPYLTIVSAAATYFPIPIGTTSQYIRGDGSLATFPTIPTVTPSALTKVDDTNVTLTLGGTPATALLEAVSLTLGWTGTLADSRISSAATWNAKQDAITLTTTGTSGPATLVGATLNIPQYLSVYSFETGNISPSDSTTYYFGFLRITPNTTATNQQFQFGRAGTIVGAIISVGNNVTTGTTESSTLQFRNITTLTSSSIGTFTTDGSATVVKGVTYSGLNISFAANDYCALQWNTPNWATNPATFIIFVQLIIKHT